MSAYKDRSQSFEFAGLKPAPKPGEHTTREEAATQIQAHLFKLQALYHKLHSMLLEIEKLRGDDK